MSASLRAGTRIETRGSFLSGMSLVEWMEKYPLKLMTLQRNINVQRTIPTIRPAISQLKCYPPLNAWRPLFGATGALGRISYHIIVTEESVADEPETAQCSRTFARWTP